MAYPPDPLRFEEMEEVVLSPAAQAEHDEYVRRVASEHGFPLSDWKPAAGVRYVSPDQLETWAHVRGWQTS